MMLVTINGGAAPLQEALFDEAGSGIGAEPVLMALHAEYCELIWQGLKTHRLSANGLRAELGRFHPPQGYVRGIHGNCLSSLEGV
jgi:hypothetical protein